MTCVLPWFHVATSASGTLRPCCHADHNLVPKKPDGKSYRLDRSGDLESYWNSPDVRALRRDLQEGKKPAICSRCWKEEESGLRSPRQAFNAAFSSLVPQIETLEDGSAPMRLAYLDLRFGNLCNLKCRMCGPYSSDRFLDEWNKANPEDALPSDELTRLGNLRWWDSPIAMNALIENLDEVQLVYSTGGEPTLAEGFYRFMDLCIERGASKNITIKLNTNLTNWPTRLTDRLIQFGGVILNLSIDAIGPLARYIRHPSDWNTVDKNLEKVDSLVSQYGWTATVHTTVQVLSITRLIEVLDRVIRLNAIDRFPFLNILDHPGYQNVRVLPTDIKMKIATDLREWHRINAPSLTGQSKEWAKSLLSLIDYMLGDDHSNLLPTLAIRTARLDTLRGENLRDVLPELDEILTKYRP